MQLILYSKPGCHLCEGLQEKLEQITSLSFDLEIRDITTREDWFQRYQYEIPVLLLARSQELGFPERQPTGVTSQESVKNEVSEALILLPRPSPRASVRQLEQMLQKYLPDPAQ